MAQNIDKLAILTLDANADIIAAVTSSETSLYVRSIQIIKFDPTLNIYIDIQCVQTDAHTVVACKEGLVFLTSCTKSAIVNRSITILIEYSVGGS